MPFDRRNLGLRLATFVRMVHLVFTHFVAHCTDSVESVTKNRSKRRESLPRYSLVLNPEKFNCGLFDAYRRS